MRVRQKSMKEKLYSMEDFLGAYNRAAHAPDGCWHKEEKEVCGCDKPYPCFDCISSFLLNKRLKNIKSGQSVG